MMDLKLPWKVLHPSRKTFFAGGGWPEGSNFIFTILNSENEKVAEVVAATVEDGATKANAIADSVNMRMGEPVESTTMEWKVADPEAYGFHLKNTKLNSYFSRGIADDSGMVAIVLGTDQFTFEANFNQIFDSF